MFHRPPKKYSEYLVNVEQSIDWILKTLWKLKKGEFSQNLQEVTDEGNTTTNIIDTAGTKSDYFQLDTAATPTLLPGMFGWNDSDGTANLRLKGNNVTLQVGQETVARVVNKTGADLLESQYKVVRVRIASEGGAQGQRLAVVLAQGNNDPDSATTLGIVTETIANNQEGFITTSGNVNGINTTGSLQGETWVDGDVLYLSPTISGSLTKVKPIAPQHTVIVGYVLYAHNNQGKIFVKVDNGYELDELHNVKITSVQNNDGLIYDSALGYWKNSNTVTVQGNTFNAANKLVQLDGTAKLPAVDGSQLINLPIGSATQTALDLKTNKLIVSNRQTASYTLVLSDADKLVEMNVGSANNLTVPLNSSVAFATGTQILLAQYGAGQTTIVATSGVTVRSNGAKLKLNAQYSGATLIKIATDEWYLFGDITA